MKNFGKLIAGIGVVSLALVNGARDAQSLTASTTASASATINTVFTLSLGSSSVAFGALNVGQTKEFPGSTGYHHTLTVNSNQTPWYVKVSVTGSLASGADTISNTNFYWILDSTNGTGTIANLGTYTAFTTSPVLTYTASTGDTGGQDIDLRYRYQLVDPSDQEAGTYTATITYELTQIL